MTWQDEDRPHTRIRLRRVVWNGTSLPGYESPSTPGQCDCQLERIVSVGSVLQQLLQCFGLTAAKQDDGRTCCRLCGTCRRLWVAIRASEIRVVDNQCSRKFRHAIRVQARDGSSAPVGVQRDTQQHLGVRLPYAHLSLETDGRVLANGRGRFDSACALASDRSVAMF